MASEKHNQFLRDTIVPVGRQLLDQGTFTEQMVALESLTTALFVSIIACAGKSHVEADAYLSALTHGVRGRLDQALMRAAAARE